MADDAAIWQQLLERVNTHTNLGRVADIIVESVSDSVTAVTETVHGKLDIRPDEDFAEFPDVEAIDYCVLQDVGVGLKSGDIGAVAEHDWTQWTKAEVLMVAPAVYFTIRALLLILQGKIIAMYDILVL